MFDYFTLVAKCTKRYYTQIWLYIPVSAALDNFLDLWAKQFVQLVKLIQVEMNARLKETNVVARFKCNIGHIWMNNDFIIMFLSLDANLHCVILTI